MVVNEIDNLIILYGNEKIEKATMELLLEKEQLTEEQIKFLILVILYSRAQQIKE